VVLAADLLAASVESMMSELAGAERWPAALRVREALKAYFIARGCDIPADDDPQKMNCEPAPHTERSVHRG
jgi:hypothetical protein